ncbi:MAG: TonB family protein [Tannerella sp.]|jgi:TonB family protein|nr:TonB family protein [Tannerella sp.]
MLKKIISIIGLFCLVANAGFSQSESYSLTSGRRYYKERQYGQALAPLQNAAREGVSEAQYYLGCMYCEGLGVEQDSQIGLAQLKRAAEQNYLPAQLYIGNCFFYGKCVQKDLTIALGWYEKAADNESSDAQYAIGAMYEYGIGVDKNEKKAFLWYQKAAENKHPVACEQLSEFYFYGKGGLDVNKEISSYWHKKAKSFKLPEWNLSDDGVLTFHGTGTIPDYDNEESTPWYAMRKDIQQIVIEEGVLGVGRYAFKGLENLTSVVIPQSVLSMEDGSFANCRRLSHVEVLWDMPIGMNVAEVFENIHFFSCKLTVPTGKKSNYTTGNWNKFSSVVEKKLPEKSSANAASGKVDANTVYNNVEKMPVFPGGEMALLKWIAEHIHYPVVAAENKIQGSVKCAFVVNVDGSVCDVEVVTPVDPMLDKEALRVIKLLPRFKPGELKGEPVRVKYTVPVRFRLTYK